MLSKDSCPVIGKNSTLSCNMNMDSSAFAGWLDPDTVHDIMGARRVLCRPVHQACQNLQRHSGLVVLQVSSLRELHQQAQKYNSQLQEYNTKLQQDLALSNDNLQKLQVQPACWTSPGSALSLQMSSDLYSVKLPLL